MDRTEDFGGETPSEKLVQKQLGFRIRKVFIFWAIFFFGTRAHILNAMKNPRK